MYISWSPPYQDYHRNPPPFIFVPTFPLFQCFKLGLEARGPSAAAKQWCILNIV
jgi:hypothetical protein